MTSVTTSVVADISRFFPLTNISLMSRQCKKHIWHISIEFKCWHLSFIPLSVMFWSFFSPLILILVSHAANYSGKIGSMQSRSHSCKMSCNELSLTGILHQIDTLFLQLQFHRWIGEWRPALMSWVFDVWHTHLGKTDRKAHLLKSIFLIRWHITLTSSIL